MADKTIAELPAATSVGSADLFVLEQSNAAKKLTGQILENWLVSFADGHGGIQSIAKTGTSGTNPVVDTYTITLADTTTFNFTVTNGIKGDTGAQTYVWVKWAAQNPTADNQMSNNPDEWIGIYIGLSSTAPAHYTDYTWYKYKGEQGNPGYAVDDVVWHESTGGNVPGIAGATDTYYMYLDDPNNTFAGQFVVYNGQDGQGSPGSQVPLSDSGSGSVGAATAYSREDHRHPLNVDAAVPSNLGTAASGSASTYARRDHVHKMPTASDVGALPNTTIAADINGMSKWVKLWENASPSSDFAAQTISLDLTGYDFVMVVYQHWTTSNVNNSAFCRIGEYGRLMSHDYTLAYRDYHLETTGVYFNIGLLVATYNSSNVTQNTSAVIPLQIYGIKGVTNA